MSALVEGGEYVCQTEGKLELGRKTKVLEIYRTAYAKIEEAVHLLQKYGFFAFASEVEAKTGSGYKVRTIVFDAHSTVFQIQWDGQDIAFDRFHLDVVGYVIYIRYIPLTEVYCRHKAKCEIFAQTQVADNSNRKTGGDGFYVCLVYPAVGGRYK